MRVEKLLKRLKREFIKVNLLQASLDSLLFFLAANLVLFLFDIGLIPNFSNEAVLAPLTFVFLVGDLIYRAKNYNLEIYEQKNPELEEILRTARDNLDRQNIVSQALFDELLDRARTVTSESIIPSKRIIQKILAVGILSFLTVLSGLTGFQIQEDGGDILPEIDNVEDIVSGEEEEEFELRNDTDIYSEKDEIDPAEMDIDFNITGTGKREKGEKIQGRETGELTLDVSGDAMNQDMDLAREYSLAIKNLEQ